MTNGQVRAPLVAENVNNRRICPIGTCITASKTATGSLEQTARYVWDISKSVRGVPMAPIPRGECVTLAYNLVVTRTLDTLTRVATMHGEVCVRNNGPQRTQGLTISDKVQVNLGLGFTDIPGASVVITPGELNPGESKRFPVTISFAAPLAGVLRNVATVTITNFIGHPGVPSGPTVTAGFTLPPPTQTIIDATANVTDEEICPPGFTCTPSNPGPFPLTGSQTVEFTKQVCNVSACDAQVEVLDQAILVTTDTSTRVVSQTVTVPITAPPCPPPPPPPPPGRGLARVATPL